MEFYKKIISLLEIKGVSQQRMTVDLNLARNTMYNWKRHNNIPNGETLLKLSEYFNVSVDCLLENENFCLTDDEQKLINHFRNLNQEQQEKLLQNIIVLYNSTKNKGD